MAELEWFFFFGSPTPELSPEHSSSVQLYVAPWTLSEDAVALCQPSTYEIDSDFPVKWELPSYKVHCPSSLPMRPAIWSQEVNHVTWSLYLKGN